MKYTILTTLLLLFGSMSHDLYGQTEQDMKNIMSELGFHETVHKLTGKKMPSFQLIDLYGDTVKLKDFEGKKVLINFWFTRCQPCIDEIPTLNEIKNEFDGKSVAFLAITYQNADEIKHFLQQHKFGYTHLVNGRDYIDSLDIKMYPKTIILDQNHIVKKIIKKMPHQGSKDDNEKWKEDILNSLH